jgi:hypothetical protein
MTSQIRNPCLRKSVLAAASNCQAQLRLLSAYSIPRCRLISREAQPDRENLCVGHLRRQLIPAFFAASAAALLLIVARLAFVSDDSRTPKALVLCVPGI